MEYIPGTGLILPGPLTRDAAAARAEAWLETRGMDAWDIEELHVRDRLVRSWFCERHGFVQRTHSEIKEDPEVECVTRDVVVVDVPDPGSRVPTELPPAPAPIPVTP